jgi:ribosomal protein S18 acetylase RimI-like enzyme
MARGAQRGIVPRTLTWATELDVLPGDRVVERAGDHLVIRSPSNPTHWWGNYLLFDDAPREGDGERWEGLFVAAFPDAASGGHRSFAWDRGDDETGQAIGEFVRRGFALDRGIGLVAAPAAVTPHPRANREVTVRALQAAPGADDELWEAALAVQIANNDADDDPIPGYGAFARRRQHDLRGLLAQGRGAWYVALDPTGGGPDPAVPQVVASCGVVVTGSRARFQQVDTAPQRRRRGICRRLVAEAAAHAAAHHELEALVIVADAGYHALGIYESLGFTVRDRTCQLNRPPTPG